jgi:hypothetical protein
LQPSFHIFTTGKRYAGKGEILDGMEVFCAVEYFKEQWFSKRSLAARKKVRCVVGMIKGQVCAVAALKNYSRF